MPQTHALRGIEWLKRNYLFHLMINSLINKNIWNLWGESVSLMQFHKLINELRGYSSRLYLLCKLFAFLSFRRWLDDKFKI